MTREQNKMNRLPSRYDPATQVPVGVESAYRPGEIGRLVAREIWDEHIKPALAEMDRQAEQGSPKRDDRD